VPSPARITKLEISYDFFLIFMAHFNIFSVHFGDVDAFWFESAAFWCVFW